MRIAIVDLLFSWPPRGGADVDVYHVARGMGNLGHETRLFVTHDPSDWEQIPVDSNVLPFSTEPIIFSAGEMTETSATSRVRAALDRWRPDVVLLMQGYFLKIPLILALRDYPVISRCHAHEIACHKDILRFRDGAPCPNEYRCTPDVCRSCALTHQRDNILHRRHVAWTREYMAARAWEQGFYDRFMEAMNSLHAVIITTEQMRPQVAGLCENIHVIPHGTAPEVFTPAARMGETEKPVIIAPGRMEDPAKGLDTLLDAAALLAEAGENFELRVTVPPGRDGPAWLKNIGKMAHHEMPDFYRNGDICVVPSVWDEPFGIVALEAMASALPVCASRVGGLQDIVLHEETGFLFDRGDADMLASMLHRLFDDPGRRRALGDAGRRRVINHYSWDVVLERYYPPLLGSIE